MLQILLAAGLLVCGVAAIFGLGDLCGCWDEVAPDLGQ